MDFTVVFATLCEMIALAYKKFDTHKANIITESEVFHKIDVRLKVRQLNRKGEWWIPLLHYDSPSQVRHASQHGVSSSLYP